MKKQLVCAFLAIVIPLAAQAGREGNGGDPLAFEFNRSALEAIQDVQNSQGEYPSVKAAELSAMLSRMRIIIVNERLFAKFGKTKQESAAVNYPDSSTIFLNRDRWASIQNKETRKALALHELLGLMGKEETGIYAISQKYLNNRGVSCGDDLCLSPPREIGFTYAEAARLFGEARMPSTEELNRIYYQVGTAFEKNYAKTNGLQSWYTPKNTGDRLEFASVSNFSGSDNYYVVSSFHKESSDYLDKVVTVSKENNAACFSNPSGEASEVNRFGKTVSTKDFKSYFNYHCRILATNSDRMLCAQILVIDARDDYSNQEKRFDKKTNAYFAFTLKK